MFQTSRSFVQKTALFCAKHRPTLVRSLQSTFSSQPQPQRLPPNLTFDPRSSFVTPQKDLRFVTESESEAEEDDGEEEEEELVVVPEKVVYAVPLPERLHVKVHTLFPVAIDDDEERDDANQVGSVWLNEAVFGCDPIRVDLLKRAVDYYRAKKRGRRKAVTKTIGEVSGSGRKLRRQKGTGQARVGHSRPPHFRGGAKAHGPKNVTDYGNTKLNKKVRRLALMNALSQKLKEGNLMLINQFYDLPSHKTSQLVRLLAPWNIGAKQDGTSAFILDHYYPENEEHEATPYNGVPLNLFLASSNVPNVKVGNQHSINVYDILKHEKLVLTLAVLQQLEQRLSKL
ncbi:large subunit ribosomal protein L4 [Fistulifera solaris]|uniref:Large ribosomal subunit protein uL4m n=1 Tax=Fistulifera solaris TaxID=1519565 RepID=A0A1Z5KPD0_FISSO|nr:large subunit ribosomal protein L4 [Fistulifera solaris]|eukprot:GAX28017.1 large subunit ribosomal protein L4 [Fistulifera solaris]